MKRQAYPFRSSALAKQAVIVETTSAVYPFRDKTPSSYNNCTATISKPARKARFINDAEDAAEFARTILLFGMIIIVFILAAELVPSNWVSSAKAVLHV